MGRLALRLHAILCLLTLYHLHAGCEVRELLQMTSLHTHACNSGCMQWLKHWKQDGKQFQPPNEASSAVQDGSPISPHLLYSAM